MPVESIILSLSSLGITNFFSFPFLTSPSEDSILSAVRNLYMLGCIYPTDIKFDASEMINNCLRTSFLYRTIWKRNYQCASLGVAINKLNLMPQLSKFLLLCIEAGYIDEGIILASSQSVDQIFQLSSNGKLYIEKEFKSKISDQLAKYNAVRSLLQYITKNKGTKIVHF
jgi:HrpA-like RNA helicase